MHNGTNEKMLTFSRNKHLNWIAYFRRIYREKSKLGHVLFVVVFQKLMRTIFRIKKIHIILQKEHNINVLDIGKCSKLFYELSLRVP